MSYKMDNETGTTNDTKAILAVVKYEVMDLKKFKLVKRLVNNLKLLRLLNVIMKRK